MDLRNYQRHHLGLLDLLDAHSYGASTKTANDAALGRSSDVPLGCSVS